MSTDFFYSLNSRKNRQRCLKHAFDIKKGRFYGSGVKRVCGFVFVLREWRMKEFLHCADCFLFGFECDVWPPNVDRGSSGRPRRLSEGPAALNVSISAAGACRER